eukprot:GDKJ01018013.1.p1 GENE.GDKJ01018013.1~~GDKJ01018013.1.p1  ORF type:complete len:468 (+),score=48.57 GDKJ01018013.1:207-1406(+)
MNQQSVASSSYSLDESSGLPVSNEETSNLEGPTIPIPASFEISSDFSLPESSTQTGSSLATSTPTSSPDSGEDEPTTYPTELPTQPTLIPIDDTSLDRISISLAAGTCIPCPALGLTVEEHRRLNENGGVALRMAYFVSDDRLSGGGDGGFNTTTESPTTVPGTTTDSSSTDPPSTSTDSPQEHNRTKTESMMTVTRSIALTSSSSITNSVVDEQSTLTKTNFSYSSEVEPVFTRTPSISSSKQPSQTITNAFTRTMTQSQTATIGPKLVWVELKYCDECPMIGSSTYTMKPSVNGESAAGIVGLVIGVLALIVHLVVLRYGCKKPMRKQTGSSQSKRAQNVADMATDLDGIGIMGSISDRETALQVANNYQRFVMQQMMSEFMAMNGNQTPSGRGLNR